MLRQSGTLAAGSRQHVYAADMRREVALQFYPDGFEWLDADPVPLSLGFSSHSVRSERAVLLCVICRIEHGLQT